MSENSAQPLSAADPAFGRQGGFWFNDSPTEALVRALGVVVGEVLADGVSEITS